MLEQIYNSIALAMFMTAMSDLIINLFTLKFCKSCFSFWLSLAVSIILYIFGVLNTPYEVLFIISLTWILTIKTDSL